MFKILFDNRRVKTYSTSMASVKAETFSWDGTTFYKVETRDYKKGSWSWKTRSVKFEIKANEAEKEFVVESVPEDENCENSPLKHLISECKGAVTARIMRKEEKLH